MPYNSWVFDEWFILYNFIIVPKKEILNLNKNNVEVKIESAHQY